MSNIKWWGYLHINNSIQAKRFFDYMDINEARTSSFIKKIVLPFEAPNREEALKIIKDKLNEDLAY